MAATSFSVMNMVEARAGGVVVGSDGLAGIGVVVISFKFNRVACFDVSSATTGLFSSVGDARGETVLDGGAWSEGDIGDCGRGGSEG